MKSIIQFLILCITISLSANTCTNKKFIIVQAAAHPALDKTTAGIRDTLIKKGIPAKDIETFNMQGKPPLAQAFLSTKMTSTDNKTKLMVMTVGTTPSQIALNILKCSCSQSNNIRIIFATVTDPVESGLVNNLNNPSRLINGVSNMIPIEPQIDIFMRVQPSMKSLGILYNPSESNSVTLVKKIEAICKQKGIQFFKQAAQNIAMMPAATNKLASRVDAIFVTNDNTALSCIPIIAKVARSFSIPLYVSDTDVLSQGATLAYGPDQYDIGAQAALMALEHLQGKELDTMPVIFPQNGELMVNTQALEPLKNSVIIPNDIACGKVSNG